MKFSASGMEKLSFVESPRIGEIKQHLLLGGLLIHYSMSRLEPGFADRTVSFAVKLLPTSMT